MNQAHKTGKLKNRLNRLKKRLLDENLPIEQKDRISKRLTELEVKKSDK